MKVVQINSSLSGSPGALMRSLSHAMDQNGIENKMLYTFGSNKNEKDSCCYSNWIDIKFNALLSRVTGRYGFVSKANTNRLISYLDKYRPDLIHMHVIHGHDFNISRVFSYLKDKNIPVVFTFHDCWMFTGYCWYYTMTGCNKYKTECVQCPLRKKFSWFSDKSARNYYDKNKSLTSIDNLTIVTPSYWMKEQVSQSFLKEKKCLVIPNGIDTDTFHPVSSDIKIQLHIENKKMMLAVANDIGKSKGVDDLLKIGAILPKEYVLVLVGVPEGKLKNVSGNIITKPRTEKVEELVRYYSAADVFINPTHEDNFPTVNLEALACGTPVATYLVGGSPESLTKETGIAVPDGNYKALMQAAMKLADRKHLVSDACRKHAVECYDRKLFTKRHLELYQKILENR